MTASHCSLCSEPQPHLFAVILGIRGSHHELASISKSRASPQELGLRVGDNVEKMQLITCKPQKIVGRCDICEDVAKCLLLQYRPDLYKLLMTQSSAASDPCADKPS